MSVLLRGAHGCRPPTALLRPLLDHLVICSRFAIAHEEFSFAAVGGAVDERPFLLLMNAASSRSFYANSAIGTGARQASSLSASSSSSSTPAFVPTRMDVELNQVKILI